MEIAFPAVGNKPSPRVPLRVVLNTKTLSLFSSNNYDQIFKSFDLKYLNIGQS
jgi:hypothetical protein